MPQQHIKEWEWHGIVATSPHRNITPQRRIYKSETYIMAVLECFCLTTPLYQKGMMPK
ncbi:hypothetical protein ML435_09970 [Staphylococcus roterodami]|nr:hypothetical protein ML435_09970 [Staphylococcus roterodami]